MRFSQLVERVRYHDGDTGLRVGWWRRLTLRHGDDVFLDRWGIDLKLFGVFIHHIAASDPGLDLHDHPWPFVSLILWGGYTEEVADSREAAHLAKEAEDCTGSVARGAECSEHRRGSVHRMRMTEAHRIVSAKPRTLTLVLRGRKTRQWGFCTPDGWIDQFSYDYQNRRPMKESR